MPGCRGLGGFWGVESDAAGMESRHVMCHHIYLEEENDASVVRGELKEAPISR